MSGIRRKVSLQASVARIENAILADQVDQPQLRQRGAKRSICTRASARTTPALVRSRCKSAKARAAVKSMPVIALPSMTNHRTGVGDSSTSFTTCSTKKLRVGHKRGPNRTRTSPVPVPSSCRAPPVHAPMIHGVLQDDRGVRTITAAHVLQQRERHGEENTPTARPPGRLSPPWPPSRGIRRGRARRISTRPR